MLPCRDAAAHRADPRRNTLAHGKMDARCERAVGDLDQHRAPRGHFPQSLPRLALVGEREHLVLEPAAPVDWKSVLEGKSVSVRVDVGGGRLTHKIKMS